MTTSTPPAWHWLEERYVPVETPEEPVTVSHEYGQMREEALSMDARNLPDSATLHAQNDSGAEPEVSSSATRKLEPDPTGEDVWPLERAVSQTGNTTVAGNSAHRIGTCYLDPDTGETVMPADFFGEKELRWRTDEDGNRHHSEPIVTDNPFLHEMMGKVEGCAADKLCGVRVEQCPVCLHEMENDEGILCDHCEETIGVESCAFVNGPGGVFVYHLRCYDEVYWGTESVDKTLDTLDPSLDTVQCPDVPFVVQEFMFESLAEHELGKLHDLMDDHAELILEMARDRFRKGFAQHGSTMYSWSPERRLDETLQELADAVVYPTSGPLE